MTKYLKNVGEVLGIKGDVNPLRFMRWGCLGLVNEERGADRYRARCDPKQPDDLHQRLTYFLSEPDWIDAPIRRLCAKYALEKMSRREAVVSWIITNSGF